MKTKHTQGEWHACCLSAKPHFIFAGEGDKTICSMFCNDEDEKHYENMLGVVTKAECVANAKLIAASPDMLEALIELSECDYTSGTHLSCAIVRANNAINKATQ